MKTCFQCGYNFIRYDNFNRICNYVPMHDIIHLNSDPPSIHNENL